MRILPLVALLLAPVAADAQTTRQTGLWLDAQPGLGLGGQPFGATFGVRGSVGVWRGNYDDAFALGRSWGWGASVRVDFRGDSTRVAPMLELRRTLDLLVLGLRWRVMAGPEWEGDKLGVGARVGGTVKVRPSPFVGPTLDLEAGAAWIDGRVGPRIALSLGIGGAFPVAGRKPPEQD
jgi:hypothetical protein